MHRLNAGKLSCAGEARTAGAGERFCPATDHFLPMVMAKYCIQRDP